MTGDIARGKRHAHHARHHDQAQNSAIIHHDAEHREQRYSGNQHLRQALADQLAHGIHVVGVIAHDIASAVGIKILDGQILHVVEHLFPHLLEGALRDDGHHLRIERARHQADGIHHQQDAHKAKDLARHSIPIARLIRVIHDGDDVLHKDRGNGTDDGVDEDTHQRNRQQHRIELKQRAQQAAQYALGRALAASRRLALRGGIRIAIIRHLHHPPCSASCRPRGKSRWSASIRRACQSR